MPSNFLLNKQFRFFVTDVTLTRPIDSNPIYGYLLSNNILSFLILEREATDITNWLKLSFKATLMLVI